MLDVDGRGYAGMVRCAFFVVLCRSVYDPDYPTSWSVGGPTNGFAGWQVSPPPKPYMPIKDGIVNGLWDAVQGARHCKEKNTNLCSRSRRVVASLAHPLTHTSLTCSLIIHHHLLIIIHHRAR